MFFFEPKGAMNLATAATNATPRTRLGFALRVRTLLVLVAIVAGTLGFMDWWKRWSAVQALVSRVPVSVFIRSRPSFPDQDPTYDPGGTFKIAVNRVRELHEEANAVAAVRKELRKALEQRDEKAMIGALAAMMDLGPSVAAAGPEVLEVIQITSNKNEPATYFDDAKMLAVHVVGIIAKNNQRYVTYLLDSVFLTEHRQHDTVWKSALNELAPFIQNDQVSASKLMAALDESTRRFSAETHIGSDDRSASIIALLRFLNARPGSFEFIVPKLKQIANDHSRDPHVQWQALHSMLYVYKRLNSASELEEFCHYLDEIKRDPRNKINNRSIWYLKHEALSREFELRGTDDKKQIALMLRKFADHALGPMPVMTDTTLESHEP